MKKKSGKRFVIISADPVMGGDISEFFLKLYESKEKMVCCIRFY